jgi:hypothetical protein
LLIAIFALGSGISRLAPPHPGGHALVAISNTQPAGVLELASN